MTKRYIVPMVQIGIDSFGVPVYQLPEAYAGLEITRALGRACGGTTLVTRQIKPMALCEECLYDGKPYLVCVHF